MRFHIDFAVSIPKDAAAPALNEDAWAHNETFTCFALSDGASESFDSQKWAQSLVRKYVNDQCFDPVWVDTAVQEYAQSVAVDRLGWAAQSAFARGSFATLLGVTLADNATDLDILCVGDCLALHLRNGIVRATYPFSRPEQFDSRPTLVSTLHGANTFLNEPGFFTKSSATWAVLPGDVILAVTDAVGQWLLSETVACGDVLDALLQMDSPGEFTKLIDTLRTERRIKLDDSTLLRLIVE